jgi:hypothetical protein
MCAESMLRTEAFAVYQRLDAELEGKDLTTSDRADRDLIRVEIAFLVSADASVRRLRTVARRIAGSANELSLAVERQSAEKTLTSLGWSPRSAKEGPRYDASAYVKACKQAAVPVPGPLNADPGWSGPIGLEGDAGRYLILPQSTDASMWTFRDPDGGYCVTLRRQEPDSAEPPLIGTICINAGETQSCFFDNVVEGGVGGRRLYLDEYSSTDLSSLRHPLDGEDDCDTCHIGANPFMVDPMTDLGKAVAKQYGSKKGGEHFEFAGFDGLKEGWYNLGLITGSTGCMECHDLPAITKGDRFCAAIIEKAANTTMPPGYWNNKPLNGRKPLWPDDNGCFDSSFADLELRFDRNAIFDSLRQIRSLCSGKKIPVCPSPDGLAGSDGP